MSSEGWTLKPMIILSSSGSVLHRYTSFLEIGPMSALMIWICFSFRRTSRASRDPRESAFATIPVSLAWISSDISSANSCVIFLIVFFGVITWKGIPGRISSLDVIWSFIPVAAFTFCFVL